ncbi:MAG: hypothetical protein AAFU64_14825 [Bacteroidota bacterium]
MRKVSIEAGSSPGLLDYVKEIIQYRDLILVLAYRDLKIRYAQTFLGFSWAVLQPTISLIIFTLVFHLSLSVSYKPKEISHLKPKRHKEWIYN